MTLLQEALTLDKNRKEYRKPRKISADQIELALAWLDNQVTYTAIRTVTGLTGSNVYGFLIVGLREAYRQGLIHVPSQEGK